MSSRTLTFAVYGAIFVAIVVMAFVAARRPNWMTLPDALGAVTRNRTVRILVVIAWVWLGWHLFARGSGAFK